MMRITETTDRKYRGVVVDETLDEITLPDGFVMEVLFRRENMISNFNYIIQGLPVLAEMPSKERRKKK